MRVSVAFGLLAFVLIGSAPAPVLAQGMGGAATPQARGPAYDPNKELHAGIEAMGAGKCRAAKQNFEHVLAMIPDQPTALAFLAECEQQLGDLRGAARDFEESLRSDPNQVLPARDLAIADEKLGRHDKAMAQLQKLKARAAACADNCSEAGDLDAAVKDVEAAVTSPAKAPAG
jgi:Tfp pilus assembly protein PilF